MNELIKYIPAALVLASYQLFSWGLLFNGSPIMACVVFMLGIIHSSYDLTKILRD